MNPNNVLNISKDGKTLISGEIWYNETIYIPEGIEVIESYAFHYSNITSVVMPSTLKEIRDSAFESCYGLSRVVLNEGLTEIGTSLFMGCKNLKHINIPNSVTTLSHWTFYGCDNLRSIIIPESVLDISTAFSNCIKIEEIVIPAKVCRLYSAFQGCISLREITFKNGNISISPTAFKGCTSLRTIAISMFKHTMLFAAFPDSEIDTIRLVGDYGYDCDYDEITIVKCRDIYKEYESHFKLASMFYHNIGMNITKIKGNSQDLESFKSPDKDWEYSIDDFYDKQQSSEMLLSEDWAKSSGIGLALGWNDYRAIDVDEIHTRYGNKNEMIHDCLKLLGLSEDYPWVVASGSGTGFHIIFNTSSINDTFNCKAYTPNYRYRINDGKDKLFERIELRWKGHLVLPPSIHFSGKIYQFINGDFPSKLPATVKIGLIDKMITHFCGRASINSYKCSNTEMELARMGKFFSSYTSQDEVFEQKEDSIEWLEQCETPDSYNAIAVQYVLGQGIAPDKDKAIEYFKKANNDLSFFNLASLIGCGFLDGTKEEVDYYLNKIRDLEFFQSHVDDNECLTHIELIENNSAKNCAKGKMYLFFDTETTGLPKKMEAPSSDISNWPRLVQLSWIVCNAKGEKLTTKDYIIKPDGFEIPQSATKIHHITTSLAISKGTPLDVVIKSFLKDLSTANVVVGHNISFDKKIVDAELIRMGKTDIIDPVETICTMKSTMEFCKIRSFTFGYKLPTLQELYAKLFGKPFEDAHDSASDIKATYECFWELKKRKLI